MTSTSPDHRPTSPQHVITGSNNDGPARLTVTAEFTRKSIPTRLRESSAPGRMVHSVAAGALRWVLPDGTELTPGEAATRFLS